MSPRHDALLDEIARLEVIVTDSVMEALALENNLIKQRIAALQHPAARRQELSLPAADDERGVSRACWWRAASREDGDFYAGPFLPAKLGAAHDGAVAPAVRHPLVQRGDHRPARRGRASSTTSSAASRPCVAEICTRGAHTARRWRTRGCCSKGAPTSWPTTLRDRMADASGGRALRGGGAAARRDAHRADACAIGSRRWRPPQLGDRDVFGLKVGPSGGVDPGVSRCAADASSSGSELATDAGARGRRRRRRRCSAALAQFYERARAAAGDQTCPSASKTTRRWRQWLSARAGRRVRILVPQRGDRRALVELATRNAELSYRTRFNEITARALRGASRRCAAVLDLPSLPRRIECFDISTIQGSETVASMVVLRGRPDEEDRTTGSSGIRHSCRTKGPGRFRRDARGGAAALSQAVLEAGGPFPDLIVIDGGTRAGVGGLRGARVRSGLGKPRWRWASPSARSCWFTRDRPEPIVLAENDPALLLVQRIRDEAHRFAVTFHRKARSMRDLRSELDDVPGVGPRRRQALLRALGSLVGVRRATQRGADAVWSGPKVCARPSSTTLRGRCTWYAFIIACMPPAHPYPEPRAVSGMRPTGRLHLGHLVGALKNWVALQDQHDCFYFVADWHALTSDYADTAGRSPPTPSTTRPTGWPPASIRSGARSSSSRWCPSTPSCYLLLLDGHADSVARARADVQGTASSS